MMLLYCLDWDCLNTCLYHSWIIQLCASESQYDIMWRFNQVPCIPNITSHMVLPRKVAALVHKSISTCFGIITVQMISRYQSHDWEKTHSLSSLSFSIYRITSRILIYMSRRACIPLISFKSFICVILYLKSPMKWCNFPWRWIFFVQSDTTRIWCFHNII